MTNRPTSFARRPPKRQKERIQHYVSRELRQKIRASAAAQSTTESAVTEAALHEYFDRETTDKDWLVRRLDLLSQSVAQVYGSVERTNGRVQADVEFLLDTLGVFIRYMFMTAVAKPGPDQEQRVEASYQAFVRLIRDQNRQSGRLRRDVSSVAAAATVGRTAGPEMGRL
jgi:hypothetical protein